MNQLRTRAALWSGSTSDELRARDPRFHRPAPELVALLAANRASLLAWLRSPAGDARDAEAELGAGLRRWFEEHHQFAEPDEGWRDRVVALYRAGGDDLAELLEGFSDEELADGAAAVLARHQERIAAMLDDELGPRVQEVVSGHYSPALQLQALGLAPGSAEGPVLDLGCGPTGALVQALRGVGVKALGIDRHGDAPGVIRGDWHQLDFGRAVWGTVVSHLAFSLHAWARQADEQAARRDARTYLRILQSLKRGGRFAYVPSLPAMERLLPPSDFRVERHALPPELLVAAGGAGHDLLQATHVVRLTG
jgi:SAM-dependent methyltransferase